MKNISVFFLFLILFITNAQATTHYVRPNGGSCADITSSYLQTDDGGGSVSHTRQCTGLADADYPGSGVNQACACNNLQWLVHTNGGVDTADMAAGDTVIVTGPIQVGCGLNGTNCLDWRVNINDSSKCYSSSTDTCYMTPVPSGVDVGHKTKIYGAGWDTDCSSPAEIWGAGQVEKIINLIGSDNVDIRCIKMTDHSNCTTTAPTGDVSCAKTTSDLSAQQGIEATDSSNVEFHDVSIYGMGHDGIWAGNLTNWNFGNLSINYTGWTGFDWDHGHDPGNTAANGTFYWTGGGIKHAGCSDNYPTDAPKNCVGQNQGIAADGFGSYQIGGNFYFDGVDISHNQGDGLDMLYHREADCSGGCEIHIRNSKFEGNAGNQLKLAGGTSGKITVENSQIIANCNFFNDKSYQLYSPTQSGRSGTICNHNAVCNSNENYAPTGCSVDTGGDCETSTSCRSGGDGVALDWATGMNVKFYNDTLAGSDNGYVFLNVNNYSGTTPCNGSEAFEIRNTVIEGTSGHNPQLSSISDCPGLALNLDYMGIDDSTVLSSGCSSLTHKQCADPKLAGFSGDDFDASIAIDSPVIDQGDTTLACNGDCSVDYNSFARGVSWDFGALEYGSEPTTPVCGNGIIEGAEECDSSALSGESCTSLGFDSGTLACAGDCTFDTTLCEGATCGNGIIEGGEQCDGSALNSQTCITQGFTGGTLACSGSCLFNTSSCTNPVCGNGVIEGSESCDGAALNSQTCQTLGFNTGSLACSGSCTFNTAGCAYASGGNNSGANFSCNNTNIR